MTVSANGRLLDVTAHTTLDYVEASARGPGWQDDGPAVVDVSVPDGSREAVVVELELDPTSLDRVEHHADRVTLTRDQARALADSLVTAAEFDGDDGGRRRGR